MALATGNAVKERCVPTGARCALRPTWQAEYALGPTMTGGRLRLAFLLYDGPAAPGVASAYRETHLWVNVTESGAAGRPGAGASSDGRPLHAR
jgi:hypothetical protein